MADFRRDQTPAEAGGSPPGRKGGKWLIFGCSATVLICFKDFRYETAIGILPADPRGADPGEPLPVWKLPHASGIRNTKEECRMRIPVSSFRPCQRDRAGKGKIILSCDGPGTSSGGSRKVFRRVSAKRASRAALSVIIFAGRFEPSFHTIYSSIRLFFHMERLSVAFHSPRFFRETPAGSRRPGRSRRESGGRMFPFPVATGDAGRASGPGYGLKNRSFPLRTGSCFPSAFPAFLSRKPFRRSRLFHRPKAVKIHGLTPVIQYDADRRSLFHLRPRFGRLPDHLSSASVHFQF